MVIRANSLSFALPVSPVINPTLNWLLVQSIKSFDAKWLSPRTMIFVSGHSDVEGMTLTFVIIC